MAVPKLIGEVSDAAVLTFLLLNRLSGSRLTLFRILERACTLLWLWIREKLSIAIFHKKVRVK